MSKKIWLLGAGVLVVIVGLAVGLLLIRERQRIEKQAGLETVLEVERLDCDVVRVRLTNPPTGLENTTGKVVIERPDGSELEVNLNWFRYWEGYAYWNAPYELYYTIPGNYTVVWATAAGYTAQNVPFVRQVNCGGEVTPTPTLPPASITPSVIPSNTPTIIPSPTKTPTPTEIVPSLTNTPTKTPVPTNPTVSSTPTPTPSLSPTSPVPSNTPAPSPTPTDGPAPARSCIGDRVVNDVNRNGIQDSGESGINGAKIEVFNSGNTLVSSTTSNSTGYYKICDLNAANYTVKFTLPAGFQLSDAKKGSDTRLDSNPAFTTGITDVIVLAPGVEDLSVDALGYDTGDVTGLPTAGSWESSVVLMVSGLILIVLGMVLI